MEVRRRLSVHLQHPIALAEAARLVGVCALGHAVDVEGKARAEQRLALGVEDALGHILTEHDVLLHTITLNGDVARFVDQDRKRYILQGVHFVTFDPHDLVAVAEALLLHELAGGNAIGHVGQRQVFAAPHEHHHAVDREAEQHVHRNTAHHHDQALPHGLGAELPRLRRLGHALLLLLVHALVDHATDLHVAAEGQGTDAIDRVADLLLEERIRRVEEEEELLHAHAEELGGQEVAELVQGHQNGQAQQQLTEVDRGYPSSVHSFPGRGHGAVSPHRWLPGPRAWGWGTKVAFARQSAIRSLISRNPMRSCRKAATATSLAALSTHGAFPPRSMASSARARFWKVARSGCSKVSAGYCVKSKRGQSGGQALRIGQGILDRQLHVRQAHLRFHAAIAELHQAVDDALRMHHDVDLVSLQVEEPFRLDGLQPLVHQARTVDGDLGAHVPVGMLQRLGSVSPWPVRSAFFRGTDRRWP